LNRNWDAGSDGGELVFWRSADRGEVQEDIAYAPIWNRFVAFVSGPTSYHSVKPSKRLRRSLSLLFQMER
jgi:hypothetical protein